MEVSESCMERVNIKMTFTKSVSCCYGFEDEFIKNPNTTTKEQNCAILSTLYSAGPSVCTGGYFNENARDFNECVECYCFDVADTCYSTTYNRDEVMIHLNAESKFIL